MFNCQLVAQQQDFEGVIDYQVVARAKGRDISEKAIRASLLEPAQSTVSIKNGNYRSVDSVKDYWSMASNRKQYYRFRGIDTLYYLNYSDDTTNVLGMDKAVDEKKISGFDCRRIVIYTTRARQEYFYAPALYFNPEYNKDNRIGRLDVFSRETSAIWLSYKEETDIYAVTKTAIRVESRKIDDSTFILPRLPEKKFTPEAITKDPVFPLSMGWMKYITSNIDFQKVSRYIKIPKGETMASETVRVGFMINSDGKIMNVSVLNKDKVHPKLAEEVLRVVSSSPDWKPATIFGEKVINWRIQPVTIAVTK